jgi:bile acid:Na+ symporter, BASS family
LEWIDNIRINFEGDKLVLMNLCLAFVMFGIALDMGIADFRRVLKNIKPVAVGLTSQLILLPLVTLLLILTWQPYVSIGIGLVLVAACPGGNISNFAVHLSRGNTALSVTLTSVVTLGAVVLTPFNFTFWSQWIPGAEPLLRDIHLDFFKLAGIVTRLILIPLILGMIAAHFLPSFVGKFRRPIRFLSMAIFLAFIAFAILANLDTIREHLHLVLVIVIVHNIIAFVTGYGFARLWRLPEADARAISMETGIQNSGLGLILIFNFFSGIGGMALVAAWWGIWDIFASLALALYWSKRRVG